MLIQLPTVWQLQMYQGEGIIATRVDDPSTPGAKSEATANGRFGVDVAGNGRVSSVDVFQDALDMAVNSSVVSSHHPSWVSGELSRCDLDIFRI